MQVRLCRFKSTGEIFAMKKLKKSEMLSRGQVKIQILKQSFLKNVATILLQYYLLSCFKNFSINSFTILV